MTQSPSFAWTAPLPLRRVTSATRDQVRLLLDEYMEYMAQFRTPGEVPPEPGEHWPYPTFDDAPQRGFEAFSVETSTHALVGFVFLQTWPQGLMVHEMYITTARQRMGYGMLAVDAVKRLAASRHIDYIGAEVFRKNTRAAAFWSAQGFKYITTNRRFGDDHAIDFFSWASTEVGNAV